MSFTLNSGIKIFDFIEAIWENPKSREELCKKLEKRQLIAKTETISKYIRTLRRAGFEVKSKKSKPYEITKTPFEITLCEKELNGLFVFLKTSNILFQGITSKELELLKYKFKNLINNFKEELSDNKESYYKEPVWENFYSLNKILFKKKKGVKITNLNKKITIIPKRIKYKQNGIFISFYNLNKMKVQNSKADIIKNLKEDNAIHFEYYEATVFKLTGPLRKNYILREGEIAHYKQDGVYVSNSYEEKNELFLRLMRYGANCEIINPLSHKKLFISKLKSLIEYYMSM